MPRTPTTKEQGDRRRLRALLLIAAYAALCGVPVWWRTTSVPRPPLPHGRMRALGESTAAAAATLPVHLDVYLGAANEAQPHLIDPLVIRQAVAADLGISRLDVAVKPLDPALAARLGSGENDTDADALLLEALGGQREAGRYALVVVPQQPQGGEPPALVVGRHRHAWAALPASLWGQKGSSSPGLTAAVAETVSLAARHAFCLWAGAGDGDQGQDASSSSSSSSSPLFSPGGLVLSFSLVNGDVPPGVGADPNSLTSTTTTASCPAGYAWDFAALERARLSPLLDALRSASGGGAATLGAESAVLQLSPAGAEGSWKLLRGLGGGGGEDEDQEEEDDEDDAYVDVSTDDEDEDAKAAAAATKRRRRQQKQQQRQKKGAFVLSREQLPAFADSEWPFESGRGVLSSAATMHRAAARRQRRRRGGAPSSSEEQMWARERDRSAALLAPHVLHFVTFVPRRDQRPLLVEEAAAAIERGAAGGGNGIGNNTTADLFGVAGVDPALNGYWIPSWGGVFIWNPPEEKKQQEGTAAAPPPPPPRVCALPAAAAAAAARAFATQLRALLGLPSHGTQPIPSSSTAIIKTLRLLPSPQKGLSEWEADALTRARVRVGASSAARTLRALSEVVSELPNLGMPDLIGAQVNAALDAAEGSLDACAKGNYSRSVLAASAAAAAADAAYLHPSVLSQLNFPDSHKLGVYMPYFLPASVPLVQGLAREAKRWVKRWRRKRRSSGVVGGGAVAAAVVGAGAAAVAATTPARRTSKRQNQD